MRTATILISALLLFSVFAAPAHVVMTETQVVNSATENALQELLKLRAKLEKALRDGTDVDVQIDFKKQIKEQKAELKDRKVRIQDKVKLAKCTRHITKLEKKIEKVQNSPKPDQKKIDRMNKRREWWIARQEQVRLC